MTKLNEKQQAKRLEIRERIYKVLGTTYNEIELFLLNRFPDNNVNDGYFDEWIGRLMRANATAYMDKLALDIWVAIITKDKEKYVGEYE